MQALFPVLQNFFVSATFSVRPVIASFFYPIANVFKKSDEGSKRKKKIKSTIAINHLAQELDSTHPSLASELRYFASR